MYQRKKQTKPKSKSKRNGRGAPRSKRNYAATEIYGNPGDGNRGRGEASVHANALSHQVCSLLDPFCAGAVGSKIPDSNTVRTVPWSSRQFIPVTTLANGTFACEVRPNVANLVRFATAIDVGTGDVTTWGALGAHVDNSIIATNFSEWRPVSWGARIVCSANVTESKGIVAVLTNTIADPSTDVNIYSLNYQEAQVYALAGCDVTWFGKPQGAIAHDFIALGSTANNTVLTVAIHGAAASTAIAFIELYMNFELLPKVFNAFSRIASPPVGNRPQIMGLLTDIQAGSSASEAMSPQQRHDKFQRTVERVVGKVKSGIHIAKGLYDVAKTVESVVAAI